MPSHYSQRVPANSQRAGEIIYQVIDGGLVLEEVWVLVVNTPMEFSGLMSEQQGETRQTSW